MSIEAVLSEKDSRKNRNTQSDDKGYRSESLSRSQHQHTGFEVQVDRTAPSHTSDKDPNEEKGSYQEKGSDLRDHQEHGDQDRIFNSELQHRSRGRMKDDEDGHLVFEEGDYLHKRYKLKKVLGKGCFGKVVQAEDNENNKQVAVKIVRNNKEDHKSALEEVAILKDLRQSDVAEKLVCLIEDSFHHHGHVCMVFRMLGSNIEKYMKLNRYQSFYVSDIRTVALKLCKAAEYIHSKGLVHRDLFPENVVFVDSTYEKLYAPHYDNGEYNRILNSDVRMIDFGCAMYLEDPRKTFPTTNIKAPEVLLSLRWSYPCDIWSIGCILFKMYQGEILFDTHDVLEHLAIMERVMGPFPSRIMEEVRQGKGSCYVEELKLKWNKESKEGIYVWRRFKPLDKYMRKEDHFALFDLIRQMLQLDPVKRCTASEALDHPFLHYNE